MATRLFKIGPGATDTPGDVVHLYAALAGAGNYCSFVDQAGVAYQVPTGRTLYITQVIVNGASASGYFRLGYGDNSVTAGAVAPTNLKTSTANLGQIPAVTNNTLTMALPVPATKYPCLIGVTNAQEATVSGILV